MSSRAKIIMPLGAMTLEKASFSSPSSITTGLIFSEAPGESRRFLLSPALGSRRDRNGHRVMGSAQITKAVKN